MRFLQRLEPLVIYRIATFFQDIPKPLYRQFQPATKQLFCER
jgi:hypothetical protein